MLPRLFSFLVAVNLVGSSMAVPTPKDITESQITLPQADSTIKPVEQTLPSSFSFTPGTTIRRIHRVDFSSETDRDLYWTCAGNSDMLLCRLKSATSKISIGSYYDFLVVCQGIAALMFSASIVLSVICIVWTKCVYLTAHSSCSKLTIS